ncbi:MAG: adenosylmethionine---8-amino-7-oxononanoate aminotransferase, partial [Frankiales bacterium]|nr:adenosylmethionine---8-amino-7-oxononanoate aminotransferase [Frankiales bacterium]
AAAAAIGDLLGTALQPLAALPGVTEIRRIGTMTGIEIGPFDPGLRAGMQVCRKARDRGVIVRPLGDVIVLMPPLAIGAEDLTLLVDVVSDCVREVLAELG